MSLASRLRADLDKIEQLGQHGCREQPDLLLTVSVQGEPRRWWRQRGFPEADQAAHEGAVQVSALGQVDHQTGAVLRNAVKDFYAENSGVSLNRRI